MLAANTALEGGLKPTLLRQFTFYLPYIYNSQIECLRLPALLARSRCLARGRNMDATTRVRARAKG